MALILVITTTFMASVLTLFSGFGLGTILMPVIAIFLPVPVAIALTAIVHLLNKMFKLALLWRHVNVHMLVHFGIPALLAAIPGALVLDYLSGIHALSSYKAFGSEHFIYPTKLAVGLLLIFFATAEWIPLLQKAALHRFGLPLGGILSGFFGGLSGHQGAFRSAFLIQQPMSEVSFVATNAAVAAMVDTVRLVIYGLTFDRALMQGQSTLIVLAVAASFLGVFFGTRLLPKVTIGLIQKIVAVMMYGLGGLLCLGLI